jgi:uncharacterized repeat protein (TIGR01451 family)
MSLAFSCPGQGYETYPLNYALVLSNAGPGPATNVQIYDTLPALTSFSSANGVLQFSGYNRNDAWRSLNAGTGLIARGPYNLAVGQTVTVSLVLVVQVGAAGTVLTETARAVDGVYSTQASASCSSAVAAAGTQPTNTPLPTITQTFTVSPTSSPSSTASPSSTRSPTPSATPSATPAPALSLLNSANRGAVAAAGDTLTYTLSLRNSGSLQAVSVTVWDTLPNNFSLGGSAPPGSAAGGLLSWTTPLLLPAASQGFTFWGSFTGAGVDLLNLASASAANGSPVDANISDVAVGSTFTNSPTPSMTSTVTPSATASSTPTPVLGPPNLAISMVQDQGSPWPSQGFLNLGYTISFKSLSGCACALAPDLVLTFYSDQDYGCTELDSIQAMSGIGLAGPGNPLANFYWKQMSINPAAGIATGSFVLAPGYKVTRQVYSQVQPYHTDQLITAAAVLSSATYGLAVTATVSTYIYSVPPTATPPPSPTPTPVAEQGRTVAYPQPVSDTLCLAYFAPLGGPLVVEVYNLALHRVARITDQAQGGKMESVCVPATQLAPGAYLYRAKVGDYAFPPGRFAVMR